MLTTVASGRRRLLHIPSRRRQAPVCQVAAAYQACLDRLLKSNCPPAVIKAECQRYYDNLNNEQKHLVWVYANRRFPKIKTLRSESIINWLWQRTFYNEDNLLRIVKGYGIKAEEGYGLIYCYLIDGRPRYVGQTQERSLKWRMVKKQADGQIGYNRPIKRTLLNAYRDSRLSIWTKTVQLDGLDYCEEVLIKYFGRTYQLWNQVHNRAYFKITNYNS